MTELIRYAVLGLVAREPTHGYALCSEVQRWPVSSALRPKRSTVYYHLKRLAADGLVEPATQLDSGPNVRTQSRVFRVTPEGARQLDQYVQTAPQSFAELCVRISSCRPCDLPQLIDLARALERQSTELFQEHTAGPDALALDRRGAPWRMVVRALVARAQASDAAAQATILGDLRSDLEALEEGA